MDKLPAYINLVFIATTFITAWLFYVAARRSLIVLFILIIWLILQACVSLSGFYTVTNTVPPHFLLLPLPPLLIIIILFVTKKGRGFIDRLNIKTLTILHMIRIPVELTLLWLFIHAMVPKLMTFEGRNFDVLSGLSAPLVYYFVFAGRQMSKKILLVWNFACLALLINIVVIAILSAPFPFQKFAFDQPDIAVLYFPFSWLPCCVVPIVLLSHLASIRQLLTRKESKL